MAPASKRRKLSNESNDDRPVQLQNEQAQEKRHSLFVRNLAPAVTQERLVEHFSQSFPLKHATIVLDHDSKQSRGFGFVTFADAEDAQAALAEFNDSILEGRKIKVEVAEARNREISDHVGGRASSKNIKGEELRAKRQQSQQDNKPPKLIVRNLPWSVKTSEDLAKLFLSYGKVKEAIVPSLGSNKKMQAGYGIVIIRGKENAERALKGVNGKVVDGRTLAVDWAVDKQTWQQVKQQELAQQDEETTAVADKLQEEKNDDATSSTGAEVEDDEDRGVRVGSETSPEDVNASDDDDDDAVNGDNDLDESDIESIVGEDADGAADQAQSISTFNTENTTIFIRNLPYDTTDEDLYEHFTTHFGPVRYARVVFDTETDRPRGTGFVCFRHESDAKSCVQAAPKQDTTSHNAYDAYHNKQSILQNSSSDPSGKYTLSGRLLSVTRALPKNEADRRASESATTRLAKQQSDKRRLYLLSEGTISAGSKLYNSLSKTEIDMRAASAKQRQKLAKTNPNLGLSLTRLSVRNLPRFVDGRALKSLAREAIVGFATDVKAGLRQPISKEELARDGEAGKEAEAQRKAAGRGVVRQAKIVYESETTGGKVAEGKGGRSRGYGFIEYWGHRSALMGLRWLNGHLVKRPDDKKGSKTEDDGEKGKRLIVEFAIENAQVVQRRNERERRVKDRHERGDGEESRQDRKFSGGKRKRADEDDFKQAKAGNSVMSTNKKPRKNGTATAESDVKTKAKAKAKVEVTEEEQVEKNKTAMRNRIIAQKRAKRKGRK